MNEQQYALVHSGEVLLVSAPTTEAPEADDFSSQYPAGSKWLPIVNAVERPFDPERDWRLKPYFMVQPDCVQRVYSVVRKSWEHA